jgi:GxxExxY protein
MSISQPQFQFAEITGKIIAVAFEVHNIIGCGFQESIYHRSLEVEFRLRGIRADSEKEVAVYYKNEKVGGRRVDFLIENKVSIEIKAKSTLEHADMAQAINYLEAFNFEIGMLLNFGGTSLEYRRLFHPRIAKKYKSEKNKHQ